LDRFDLQIEVPRLAEFEFETVPKSESSKNIRQRVERAREIQRTRFAGTGTFCNAGMSSKELREFCQIGQEGKELLRQAAHRFSLSARAYTRILKLARTIADLEGAAKIELGHLAEAIQYRSLDRKGFG
jgi:magnesium chelatase family protein